MENFQLLLDEPIDDPSKDEFGHEHYAEILYSLITNDKFKKNYNIGLLGSWGVGKSSIKEFCQKKLGIKCKDNNLLVNNIYLIDFNAWKYGSEGIKRALLKHLYTKLGGEYDNFLDKLSRQIHKDSKTIEEIKILISDVRRLVNHKLSLVLIISFFILFILSILLIFKPDLAWLLAIVNTGIVTIISLYLGLFKNISLFPNLKKIDLPKTTAEEFEELLKNQIIKFKNPDSIPDTEVNEKDRIKQLIKKIGLNIHEKLRIVIFVDDLDRLPSNEMVEGINAIRTFMDLDLPEDVNIIFIISCCENKIAEALQTINFEYENNDINNIDKKIEAKRFLDKIFQFRIDIPPFPYRDMVEYTRGIITKQIPDFKNELNKKAINIENLLCRLIHPRVKNPRQAIQITNAFLQSWYIANIRERIEENKVGGLAPNTVTKYPIPLAVLSVLKVDFPYFYQELQNEPKLLKYLFDILNWGYSDIYLSQKLINEFTEGKKSESKNSNNLTRIIKEKYQDLEWYLNSINHTVEFSASLKPLLLLNQDPLTRQFDNDDATSIEEALSSRNTKDIIAIFNLKENKLNLNQANLLKSVVEQINSAVYKDTAYLTIIDLLDFIKDDTSFILDELVYAISKNPNLEKQLNLEHYEKILNTVNNNIKDQVINIIKFKYLTNLSFSIPGDELDEEILNGIYKNAKSAAIVLLDYYSNYEHKQNIESVEWLIKPIGHSTDDMPESSQKDAYFEFPFIDECVIKHKFLLKYIGKDYSEKLLTELEASVDEEINVSFKIVDSLKSVKEYLDLIKEINSADLQVILGKYISSNSVELFQFGFEYLEESIENFNKETRKYCLSRLTDAISNEISKKQLYKTEISQKFVDFAVNQVKNNFEFFEDNNLENIEEFCKILGNSGTYVDKSIELFELLENKAKNTNKITEFYIKISYENTIVTPYKNRLRAYLAQNFAKLSQAQKQKIVLNIENLVGITTLSLKVENISIFKLFIESLPEDIIGQELSNPLESIGYLFDKFFDFLINNTDVQYFMEIFLLIKDYLKYIKYQKLSDVLGDSCQKHSTYKYYEFFNIMNPIWKDLNQEVWIGNNNAQQIFNFIMQKLSLKYRPPLGSEFLNSTPTIQTDANINELFTNCYQLWKGNEDSISKILTYYKRNYFTSEQFYTLGLNTSAGKEEFLIKVWSYLVKYIEDKDKYIILKTLFAHDLDKFVIFSNILKENKNISIVIQVIIDLIIVDSKLVISHKDNITNNIFNDGKHRRGLSLKLLNLLLSEPNESLAYWAKDLYNDIMQFVKLNKFENNPEAINIINKVFCIGDSIKDNIEELESN